MKIAFLLYSYPNIGGTETVTNLLAEYFESHSHNVFLISWKKGKHGILPLFLKNSIYLLPDSTNINSPTNNLWIANFIEKEKISILINQGPFWNGSPSIKESLCKVISVLHYSPMFRIENAKYSIDKLYTEQKTHGISFRIKATLRKCFKSYFAKRDFNVHDRKELLNIIDNSDAFIVLCKEYISELEKLLQIDLRTKQCVLVAIPNPININNNTTIPKENHILYVGRLTRWDKRADRLLRIWKKLHLKYPDWKLFILGDGNEKEKLIQLSERLELTNIHFEGFQSPKEYYEKASILCLTSSSEGFPMTILESLKYKVVPIAYDVSYGITTLIENNKNGFAIKPFDETEYVNKLNSLLNSTELRNKMSIQAEYKAQEYDIKAIGLKWINLFKQLK